jgi:integrase
MSMEQVSWSAEKLQHLRDQLTGFWAQDEWNMAECPLVNEHTHWPKRGYVDAYQFTGLSSAVSIELKYACWYCFSQGIWAPLVYGRAARLHRIISWLKHTAPLASSLLERSREKAQVSLRSYLSEQGRWHPHRITKLKASQETYQITQDDMCIYLFNRLYEIIEQAYDDRDEYDKDIWDVRMLGIPFTTSQSDYKLNFTGIEQPWLRTCTKRFMRYWITTHSVSDCRCKILAITIFSRFLTLHHPSFEASVLDRPLMVEFMGYLASSKRTAKSKKDYLTYLRTFFEMCAREGWAAFPEKRLIYNEDLPPRQQAHPRFIPQEVLDQLNRYAEELPPQVMRMLLLLQECGMRIGELCQLPVECLTQDASGDWFLRTYQSKMYKEHSIPISREGAAIIQEQQQEVRKRWGSQAHWLFSDKNGRPFKQATFADNLNRLAYRKKICDATDRLFHFQAHQFRHTVGTRMINSGVPQHIVQRFLGHATPDMTAVYAHIHDRTMKEEYAKFRGKVVDVTGTVVEQNSVVDESDFQWMKKHILAQSLPNGKCALPVVAGDCPHANACLTCVHFRTDASFLGQHQSQLQETRRLIQVARQNGWRRQVEMNEKVAANLERIITVLEEPDHDA